MIRAVLRPSWPALAQFGVTPLNFQEFSLGELEGYLDAAREQAEQIERANREV